MSKVKHRIKHKNKLKILKVLDCINCFTKYNFTLDNAIINSNDILNKVIETTKIDIIISHLYKNIDIYKNIYKRDTEEHANKHLPQETSIINHLIDVGGGNGILLHLITSFLGCKGILIDPSYPPDCVDNKIVTNYIRIFNTIDKVNENEILSNHTENDIYIIGKHLCGTATDDTLKWINKNNIKPKGIIIATCCFSRGNINDIFGKEHILLTNEQIKTIKHYTGWQGDCRKYINDLSYTLTIILNYIRINKMKKLGWKCSLVEYVSNDISPKNLMLKFI